MVLLVYAIRDGQTRKQKLKKNDPDALVVGCVFANNTVYLNKILKAGAGEYMDAISFHYYLGKYAPEEGARTMMNNIRTFAKKNKLTDPLWVTETGWANSNVDEETQAKFTSRNAVLYEDFLGDNGISGQYFAYELHDSGVSGDYLGGAAYESSPGLVKNDYSLKIAAKTVNRYDTLVKDKSFVSLTENDCGSKKTVYTAKYEGLNGDTAYIMWEIGRNIKVTLSGSENEIIDSISGESTKLAQNEATEITLSDSPIMIEVEAGETFTYEVKEAK